MDLPTFLARWRASGASERANKDSFLRDLCDVLDITHPDAKSSDPDRDRYVFEREAVLLHGGERHSVGFIDRDGEVGMQLLLARYPPGDSNTCNLRRDLGMR